MQGSQTLGKTRKNKNNQRHSAGNIDYDNLSGSQDADEPPVVQVQTQCGFRTRSKTVGESSGKSKSESVFCEKIIYEQFLIFSSSTASTT